MFLKIIIIAIFLIGLSTLGLTLTILFNEKGKFPAYRVGHNHEMRKLGITCVKHEEIHCHNKRLKEGKDCTGCQQLA